MIIVIALLGTMSLLVLPKVPRKVNSHANLAEFVRRTRSDAIQLVKPITICIPLLDTLIIATAMPDGSLVGLDESTLARLKDANLISPPNAKVMNAELRP